MYSCPVPSTEPEQHNTWEETYEKDYLPGWYMVDRNQDEIISWDELRAAFNTTFFTDVHITASYDLMRDGNEEVTRWGFYNNMYYGNYYAKLAEMMEWQNRIDSSKDMNITQAELAGAMFLGYDRMEELMNADTNNNGNITFDEFCHHWFGDAIVFCGYRPDILETEGELAARDFIEVWYRSIDRDADEVASFDDVYRFFKDEKAVFK